MSDHPDGGQNDSTVPALQQRRAPYLVRMIKPNLIVSHDWHVQPICQRSVTVSSPKRDRGSRFRNFIRMSSNLIARETGAILSAPAFLREPSKHIELRYSGQAVFVFLNLIPTAISTVNEACFAEGSRRAKYQRSTSAQSAEPLGLTGDNSRVMQWIVLCGIPYRGSGASASPDPKNLFHHHRFPLPSNGAGLKATGRLTAHLQLFKSTTSYSQLQAAVYQNFPASLQLSENSNGVLRTQAVCLWKMWETLAKPTVYRGFSEVYF